MHAVSLLVGLLNERIHHPEERRIVEKIQGSVDAMEDLFNSLLDISKLDAGAVHPAQEDFPIAPLFARVLRSFEPVAEQKSLALSVESSQAVVHSDPALLERIVFNLVSNAIRYTPAGSVSIRTEVDGDQLAILVQDSGIGIPAEYRERIFDEFFQIASMTRDRSQGLGLGLSIVKRCADLLGHRLSLTSGPHGSQFRIELPCVGAMTDPQVGCGSARAVSLRLANAFVLVIDDDAGSRYAAETSYRQWGCRVIAADSVDAAIEALSEHLRSPDLIVSDFHLNASMTGVGGVEVLRRHLEAWIPAIILSGETAALKSLNLDPGFAVLQKPAGSERLKEVSERLLSLDPQEAPSAAAAEAGASSVTPTQ
jgi:CheY-like chemotaxis protein/two-component sensor histidine kinase